MPSRPAPRTVAAFSLALLFTLVGALPARAQYFGQNKVRYEAPPFKVLKTAHSPTGVTLAM